MQSHLTTCLVTITVNGRSEYRYVDLPSKIRDASRMNWLLLQTDRAHEAWTSPRRTQRPEASLYYEVNQ